MIICMSTHAFRHVLLFISEGAPPTTVDETERGREKEKERQRQRQGDKERQRQ